MTSTEGAKGAAVACSPCNVLIGSDVKWVQPSGPRTVGQGVEDAQQGIVDIQLTPTGAVLLRITLLAAGFVIGYHGACIREISNISGADIKSWTDKLKMPSDTHRPCRNFLIQGNQKALMIALEVIYDALARYKELCEGGLQGHCVSQVQLIHGIQFLYQPPPRNVVPQAAGLQGPQQRVPMQNSNETESDKGTQAQGVHAQIKLAYAARKAASDQSPTAACYIPAHLPAKPSYQHLAPAQVQALPAATGSQLQATAPETHWLRSGMHQQAASQTVHRAQAHLSQTAISATANAPAATVYPSASLNCLPQPVGYNMLPAFSKQSAQLEQASYATYPKAQHKLQLLSAVARHPSSIGPQPPACLSALLNPYSLAPQQPAYLSDVLHQSSTAPQQPVFLSDMLTQSSISPRQPACLSDMLNSDHFRQHASQFTSVHNAAYQQQQLQLQAAAAAALQNAAYLHAGAMQSDYNGHSFISADDPVTSSTADRDVTPVSYQVQPRISLNAALHQQGQTRHASVVRNHVSCVPVRLHQHGQHQRAATPDVSIHRQLLPHEILLPDLETAYRSMAVCNASSLLAVPSHSLHTRHEHLHSAYAQVNGQHPNAQS